MLSHSVRERLAREAYAEAVKVARARPTRSAWARLLRAAKNLRDVIADAAALGAGQPNEA
jgi:hypothetical protein